MRHAHGLHERDLPLLPDTRGTEHEEKRAMKPSRFTLTIRTENEAFGGGPVLELVNILAGLTERLQQGETAGKLRDVNGNTVGSFELTP